MDGQENLGPVRVRGSFDAPKQFEQAPVHSVSVANVSVSDVSDIGFVDVSLKSDFIFADSSASTLRCDNHNKSSHVFIKDSFFPHSSDISTYIVN